MSIDDLAEHDCVCVEGGRGGEVRSGTGDQYLNILQDSSLTVILLLQSGS